MLRVLLGSTEDSLVDEIARYVSPADTKCPNCQQYWCTGRRALFATLVLLEKEDTIVNFRDVSTPVCDNTLPLREPQDGGQSAEVEALISILHNWDSQQRELFYHLQWQMKAPYFEMRNVEVLLSRQRQLLPDELVLPWTVKRKLAEHIDGEFSAVHEIQIHQDHHNPAEINSRFALKVFDAKMAPDMAEPTFEKEFNANMKLTHSRVVPLLSAFQHRDKFYLIFPWAAGGSLQDLWQNYDKVQSSPGRTASWYTTLWMMDQCFGIADALAKVHGYNTWENEDDQLSKPQLHQDIKPENIVCCRDNETSQYVLKLTDFGLSVALDRDSSLPHRKIVQSKSYRPPEADIMGSDINQTWDIWCLGCLYLEFVTWVALGWASVEGFRNQRLTEMDDEDVDTNFLPTACVHDVKFCASDPPLMHQIHYFRRPSSTGLLLVAKKLFHRGLFFTLG
ncbi:kinase-like protein [Colletotrichum zoysiae]|uniref:Kinase-like protein n=1 Tax=Colletotrichum zoysiae TaxID=1216348 RepID=A0AAD9M1G4_9PEZI|nr:kinase-like protein [Colletotrichum zoysiae]